MDKKKFIAMLKYILAGAMVLFTALYCFDIKFVVIGLNILVWDVLIGGIWIFVRLCKWANRENTGKRTLAVTAVILAGLLAAPVLLVGLAMYGGIPQYAQGTEPQTHRTFVVESYQNMMSKGTAKVYERFGPLLFPCEAPEYSGELLFDESDAEYAKVYLNEEAQSLVVSLFTYGPRFRIPLKLPEGVTKTPERVLLEQLVDDTHDAFLVNTGGEFGTLLVTAELAEESKNEFGTRDITFSVWKPAEMESPIQVFSKEVMIGVTAPEFHYTVDANFDGFQDFWYLFHAGNQPYYCHFWLWDEEQKQFNYCAPLIEISQPGFDEENQVITGWARSSGAGDGVTTFHRWENGEPVCVRRIESVCQWGEFATVSVEDRIDGELRQVYDEKFPWDAEEVEGREAWRQATYAWGNLDYHGEPTEGNES